MNNADSVWSPSLILPQHPYFFAAAAFLASASFSACLALISACLALACASFSFWAFFASSSFLA